MGLFGVKSSFGLTLYGEHGVSGIIILAVAAAAA